MTCNPESTVVLGCVAIARWHSKAVVCKSFVSNSHDGYTDGTQRCGGCTHTHTHLASETVRGARFYDNSIFLPHTPKAPTTPEEPPDSALLSNTQRVQMSPHGQRWPPDNLFDSDFIKSVNPSREYWRWAGGARGRLSRCSLKEQAVQFGRGLSEATDRRESWRPIDPAHRGHVQAKIGTAAKTNVTTNIQQPLKKCWKV